MIEKVLAVIVYDIFLIKSGRCISEKSSQRYIQSNILDQRLDVTTTT